MIAWLNMAVRNLVKNGRRSLFTILAIGFGFSAVNIFGGFTHYIFNSLEVAHIYGRANGHLTIFREGYLEKAKLDPLTDLITADEAQRIHDALITDPAVKLITPQLFFSGMISNGRISTIFLGFGRVPSDSRIIRDHATGIIRNIKLYDGLPLDDTISYGVCVSRGLLDKLDLAQGSTGIMMAPTVEGQINALDFEVRQVMDAPDAMLDDKLIIAPLAFAQSLYDTTSADRLTVLLEHTSQTEAARARLQQRLDDSGLHFDVRTWVEMSPFYTKVKDMFDVIFTFIFVIVFVIVVMSVINTIGMAVLERTREIGTLRALGLKRRGVVRLFAIESVLLGLFGSALGAVFTLGGWLVVHLIEPQWVPPQMSRAVPLEVHLVPRYMIASLFCLLLLSLLAAIGPARRAARKTIVDALGHT